MYVVGNKDHYFRVCRSALTYVQLALASSGTQQVKRILDLPCGHGRVLRGLRALYPKAELTACDLQTHGVDFCSKRFGARPVYSEKHPQDIPLTGQFDLIWSGSLLTHLDAAAWREFLTFFSQHLSVGGVCVFTAHGRKTIRHISRRDEHYGLKDSQLTKLAAQYKARGFGYQGYGAGGDYGISVSSMAWVARLISEHPELRLCFAAEMAWDAHQDVYAVVRQADTFAAAPDTRSVAFRAAQALLPGRAIDAVKKLRGK